MVIPVRLCVDLTRVRSAVSARPAVRVPSGGRLDLMESFPFSLGSARADVVEPCLVEEE